MSHEVHETYLIKHTPALDQVCKRSKDPETCLCDCIEGMKYCYIFLCIKLRVDYWGKNKKSPRHLDHVDNYTGIKVRVDFVDREIFVI